MAGIAAFHILPELLPLRRRLEPHRHGAARVTPESIESGRLYAKAHPRPGPPSRVTAPIFLGIEFHAGLVCLNLPDGATARDQEIWFEALRNQLERKPT